MKIAVVVGTRPEIIKMSPILNELKQHNIPHFVIHSNQHYSAQLDGIFFEELELDPPKYNLNVGSGKHGNQTGNILIKMEPILEKEHPTVILVQGDTNTVLAAGLAASKLSIPIGHVEAGLRSYDRTMPEETNRVIVDHLSDFLFAVTKVQFDILTQEGLASEKIHTVGNTIVDAVLNASQNLMKPCDFDYLLVTAHRAGNVDRKESLENLLASIDGVASELQIDAIFPIHPRTMAMIEKYQIQVPTRIKLREPVGYKAFLSLIKHAKLVLTDSGGVQEEACILNVPCLTMRNNTERPETVEVGANILVGDNLEKMKQGARHFLTQKPSWSCPYGDGTTAKKIVRTIAEKLNFTYQDSTPQNISHITVVGLGYMGLPMAMVLAKQGHKVRGFDIDALKVEKLKNGNLPFEENGLKELFAEKSVKSNLSFSHTLQKNDVFIISVPTPEKDHKCDLSMVTHAFENVLEVCENGNLVIVESTIKPGTCKNILTPLAQKANKNIMIAHCPERAIPGKTLDELVHNNRIVGGVTQQASDAAEQLYSTFCQGKIWVTDSTTAEAAKLMENTYRDVNIALANEFDVVLRNFGIIPQEAIDLANKHPRVNIHTPGVGVGGHCIAVDPWFLVEDVEGAPLIRLSRKINMERPNQIAERIIQIAKNYGKKIGILGVAYKPDVDDTRETPVRFIIEHLEQQGFEVRIHDPHVDKWKNENYQYADLEDWADLCVVTMNHNKFATLSSEKKPVFRASQI